MMWWIVFVVAMLLLCLFVTSYRAENPTGETDEEANKNGRIYSPEDSDGE